MSFSLFVYGINLWQYATNPISFLFATSRDRSFHPSEDMPNGFSINRLIFFFRASFAISKWICGGVVIAIAS